MNIDELCAMHEERIVRTSPYLSRTYGLHVKQLTQEEAKALIDKETIKSGERVCLMCGASLAGRGKQARYCEECAKERQREQKCEYEKRRLALAAGAGKPVEEQSCESAEPERKTVASAIVEERRKDYGQPAEAHGKVARIWNVLKDDGVVEDAVHVEALWIVEKLVRFSHTWEHEDSLLDIAGYAECALDVLRERKR